MVLVILEAIGAISLVIAYLRLSHWSESSVPFVALNLIGAALLAAVALATGRFGFAALWVVWFLAAVRSALGLLAERRA